MKWNDEAIKAAATALFGNYNDAEKKWVEEALTAAFAAQLKSEDYAGLIEALRKGHVRYAAETQDEAAIRRNKERDEAADALEALLAERDEWKKGVSDETER